MCTCIFISLRYWVPRRVPDVINIHDWHWIHWMTHHIHDGMNLLNSDLLNVKKKRTTWRTEKTTCTYWLSNFDKLNKKQTYPTETPHVHLITLRKSYTPLPWWTTIASSTDSASKIPFIPAIKDPFSQKIVPFSLTITSFESNPINGIVVVAMLLAGVVVLTDRPPCAQLTRNAIVFRWLWHGSGVGTLRCLVTPPVSDEEVMLHPMNCCDPTRAVHSSAHKDWPRQTFDNIVVRFEVEQFPGVKPESQLPTGVP